MIGVFYQQEKDMPKSSLSNKMNLVLQKEYLTISPSDQRPLLGTESVRSCYAIFIYHPEKSTVLHWDDNCCRSNFDTFVKEFLGDNLKLSECSVTIVGGWKDHAESKKNGDFLLQYFDQTNKGNLDLSNFRVKTSTGSFTEQGFSLAYLDTQTGKVITDDDWKNYSPEDETYRGEKPQMRNLNRDMLDLTHLQDDKYPESGARIYARDKFHELQLKESTRLCIAAKANNISDLVQLIDEGITNVNVSPSNAKGWTPLHYACKLGKFDAAYLLIQNGGNLFQKNDAGNAPIDFLTKGSFEHKKLLTAYRLIKFNSSQNQQSLMSISLFSRHKEMVETNEQAQLSTIEAMLQTESGVSSLGEMLNSFNA
ncbi:ankyrin repeat domain-containing protein [Legionella brunensis]|uniref:Ankyrin repeats (3 copies) n=1 Tax=Legionella brunensis TaxID=29422 RepID=A0A0W0SHS5_9GAMM|nr:ankyrin repeat domain-containing protein [Legionella brunensis]KTC82979.1 Ankyrin repeats (3 copies) [Legionella brunensis]